MHTKNMSIFILVIISRSSSKNLSFPENFFSHTTLNVITDFSKNTVIENRFLCEVVISNRYAPLENPYERDSKYRKWYAKSKSELLFRRPKTPIQTVRTKSPNVFVIQLYVIQLYGKLENMVLKLKKVLQQFSMAQEDPYYILLETPFPNWSKVLRQISPNLPLTSKFFIFSEGIRSMSIICFYCYSYETYTPRSIPIWENGTNSARYIPPKYISDLDNIWHLHYANTQHGMYNLHYFRGTEICTGTSDYFSRNNGHQQCVVHTAAKTFLLTLMEFKCSCPIGGFCSAIGFSKTTLRCGNPQ